MTINAAFIFQAISSSTGVQTFTNTAFGGETPKAAFIWIGHDDSIGSGSKNNAGIGFGFAGDNGNQWAIGMSARHNQSDTETRSYGSDGHCAVVVSEFSDSNFRLKGELDSFTTNGISIDFTDNNDTYVIGILLLGGDAFDYDIGSTLPNTSAAGAVTVSSGFTPDVIFGGTVGSNITGANAISGVEMGIGVATSSSAFGFGLNNENNLATDAPASRIDTSYPVFVPGSSGTRTEGYSFSFGSGDFDIVSESANDGSDRVYYAAFEFSQSSVYVGNVDSAASTGNQSYTDPGFEPLFVLALPTIHTSVDSAETGANAGVFGIACMTEDNEGAISIAIEDAQASTDTQSEARDNALHLENDAGGVAFIADYVSLDATGWTWNFTDTTFASRKIGVLAVEVDTTPVSPGGGITPMIHNYRMRRV